MYLAMYGEDGFGLQNEGYISALVNSIDQEAASGSAAEPEIVIGGITGVLKKSLEDSGVEVVLPSQMEKAGEPPSGKQNMIDQLRTTFEIDQKNTGRNEAWTGSSFQVMSWHYEQSLGRYFNNREEIVPMVDTLNIALQVRILGPDCCDGPARFRCSKEQRVCCTGCLYWYPWHYRSSSSSITRHGCGGTATP